MAEMIFAPLKSKAMQRMERRLGRPLEEVFRDLYVAQRMSQAEVGEELGIHPATVSRWLDELGIESRPPGRPKEPFA
jgi:CRP-like cAMP-binding protein